MSDHDGVMCGDGCGWPAAPLPFLDLMKRTTLRLCLWCGLARKAKAGKATT